LKVPNKNSDTKNLNLEISETDSKLHRFNGWQLHHAMTAPNRERVMTTKTEHAIADFSKPQNTFWQRFKSAAWIAFKCWAVWYLAKLALVAVWAASPKGAEMQNVITVAALVPAVAWYIWRYMPRRAGQLADGVEPSDGGLRKWWKNLSDGTRGNIYLTALIVVIVTLTNASNCSVRGTACYRALNYPRFDDIPDFDSLPDAGAQRSDEQFKKAVR
jgi:hypothetical protein